MNNNLIYVICGKARSGKDTLVEELKDYYKTQNKKVLELKYTFYLRRYAKNILGWDGKEETKPRSFLQALGKKLRNINSDFLIRRMLEDIEVYKDYFDILVISDTRLINEIEVIKSKYENTKTIYVKSNKKNNLTKDELNDITETELDNYNNFDYIIDNSLSLESFLEKIKKVLSEVDKNEKINK